MSLYGFDESHWQTTLIPPDFGIFKATQGVTSVDSTCDTKYQAAKAAGKLLGVYHFASFGDPVAEANFFVDNIQGYLGEAVLALDVETNTNVAWALSFLTQVYARTQVRPFIYMSAFTSNAVDWSSVSDNNALWCAGYPARFNVADPPTPVASGSDMPYSTGSWPFATIWQYSSSAGTLDRDIFYGTDTAWHKFAKGDRSDTAQPVTGPTTTQDTPPTPPVTTSPAPAEPVVPTPPPSVLIPPKPPTGTPANPTTPPTIHIPAPVETPTQAPVAPPKTSALSRLWLDIPDPIRRILHTAWQAGVGVLVAFYLTPHSTVDTKVLLGTVYATVLAAVKAALTTSVSS